MEYPSPLSPRPLLPPPPPMTPGAAPWETLHFVTAHKLSRMMEQFQGHMELQLDFDLEASNLLIFENNFKSWGNVSFPKPKLSCREVLVESFEPGQSIFRYVQLRRQQRAEAGIVGGGMEDDHVGRRVVAVPRATVLPRASSLDEGTSSSSGSTGAGASETDGGDANANDPNGNNGTTSNGSTFLRKMTRAVENTVQQTKSFLQNPPKEKPPEEFDPTLLRGDLVGKLGHLGVLALFKMIIIDNFVHADLHPGNVFTRPAVPAE